MERAGGQYYPKLQSCVPFTPVTGARLLQRPDAPVHTAHTLVSAMRTMADQTQVRVLWFSQSLSMPVHTARHTRWCLP